MVLVVLTSRYFKINPDNVATPIAASLGDLVTLALLAWVANTLFEAIGRYSGLTEHPGLIRVVGNVQPSFRSACSCQCKTANETPHSLSTFSGKISSLGYA